MWLAVEPYSSTSNVLMELYLCVCLQVHLQTQQKGKIGLVKMGIKVLKSDGIFGLYNGLTASLLRQVIVVITWLHALYNVYIRTSLFARRECYINKTQLDRKVQWTL